MLRVGEALQGPSRTAVLTAAARALHREEPQPWVMDDYHALDLAGQEGLALLDRLRAEVPRPNRCGPGLVSPPAETRCPGAQRPPDRCPDRNVTSRWHGGKHDSREAL